VDEDVDECTLAFGSMSLPQSGQAWLKVPQEVRKQRQADVQGAQPSETKGAWKRVEPKPFPIANALKRVFRVSDEDGDEFLNDCVLDPDVKRLLTSQPIMGYHQEWERTLKSFDTQLKIFLRLGVFQLHILNAVCTDLTPLDTASQEDWDEAQSPDGNLACCKLLADMTGQQLKGFSAMLAQCARERRVNVCRGLEVAKFKAEFIEELARVPSPAKSLFDGQLETLRKQVAKKIMAHRQITTTMRTSSPRARSRGPTRPTGQRLTRGRGTSAARGRGAPTKRKAVEAPAGSSAAKKARGSNSGFRGRGRGQKRL